MQGRDDRVGILTGSRQSGTPFVGVSFQPSWWCSHPHAQTIFAYLFRPFEHLPFQRRRLETPDGDFIDLDFLPGDPAKPLILVLHALEGSSRAAYVQSFLGEARKTGRPACVMNFRGCSGEPNRLPSTYHSGKTEDLDLVVNDLFRSQGQKPIDLAGYSIGGNLLLKWLGEQGREARAKIRKAVAVSVPYDLVKTVSGMDQGFNRAVYTRRLLLSLRKKIAVKARQFPKISNFKQAARVQTFREFDSLITAPLNGFKDAMEYWTRSSSLPFLKHIAVETLLIHAEDDPFFPGYLFPFEEVQCSDHLQLIRTPGGGHLGFVSGVSPWQQDLWLEKTLMEFLGS